MRFLNTLTLGLLLVITTACGGGGATPTSGLPGGSDGPEIPTIPPTTGRMLRVSVTDAPFPITYVKEASVEITEVQVRDQESGGWKAVSMSTDSITVNLVGLTGGLTEEIANVEIGAGTYDEVRLIVGPGQVLLEPDAVVADPDRADEDGCFVFTVADGGLVFPSGPQTGIKVKIDPPIVVTDQLSGDLVLDFDLAKNFAFNGPVTHAPGVKRVLFTPSVKAVNETVNGSVSFLVEASADGAAIEGAEVKLFDGDVEKSTHYTDENGYVVFSAEAGQYKATANAYGLLEGTIDPVDVVLGNLVDGGVFSLDAATDEITGLVYDNRDNEDATDDVVLGEVAVVAETEIDETTTEVGDDTTNTSGAYAISPLDPDFTYTVTFSKTGYTTVVKADESSRAAGSADTLDVILTPQSRSVTATLNDTTGAALINTTVSITDAWGTVIGSPMTDANGQFSVTLPTGTYSFGWSEGVDARTQDETIEGDEGTTAYAITLAPPAP